MGDEFENEQNDNVNEMHWYSPLYDYVWQCPNPILLIDLHTANYKFMGPADYWPENIDIYNSFTFRILLNTTIYYSYVLGLYDIFYHLELNSIKFDEKTTTKV
jgi:hypothetical protein